MKHMKDIMKVEVSKERDGMKLSNYLKCELKMSTRLIRNLVPGGYITINGKVARNRDVLKEGDKLDIVIQTNDTQDIEPEDIDIDVCYEDKDVLIVNKPPFMIVHPTKNHQSATLANGVVNYFRKSDQGCIVRLVNRLDRDTSGLVIIAKSQFAHQAMAKKLDANSVNKYYIGIVEGIVEGSDTIDLPIGVPNEELIKRCVMDDGQRSVTHYEVLKSGKNMSVLLIKLETGRTHQIRVHMSHIGHPIIGDTLYGNESDLIKRQGLHAYKLQFTSIREKKELNITANIPDDMQKVLDLIENNK